MLRTVPVIRWFLAVCLVAAIGSPAFCNTCSEPPIQVTATGPYKVCVGDPVTVTVTFAWDVDLISWIYPSCEAEEDTVNVFWFYVNGELKKGPTPDTFYETTFSSPGVYTIRVEGNDVGNPHNDPIGYTNVTVRVDCTEPYVDMTHPPAGEIHLAAGQTTAQLVGTAFDEETWIYYVKVGFTDYDNNPDPPEPSTWYSAAYYTYTHVWTYYWANAQSKRVWVRAQDAAGNTKTIWRLVQVTPNTPVVYVKPTGSDANNGSTWTLAKATVQAAINLANQGNPKPEVWVAAGTYQERITLASGVAIYGGFYGNEKYRERRDWNANETILDGTGGSPVVDVADSAAPTTRIDGFVVRNGVYRPPDPLSTCYGAGIYCRGGSPTVANNRVAGNTTDGPSLGGGAGIYCAGSPIIAGNNISENACATQGGGVLCASGSTPVIERNAICGNSATDGGGIYCDGSSAVIRDNTISDNCSGEGGGIACLGGSPSVVNNMITRNLATRKDRGGGALYCEGLGSEALIANNTVTYNETTCQGGAVFFRQFQAGPVVANNTIAYNTASGYPYSPLEGGGAIYYYNYAEITDVNNIFAFNTSPAVYVEPYSTAPSFDYNCLYGSDPLYSAWLTPGDNCAFDDPRLVGVDYANAHIQPNSPCREAGSNAVIPQPPQPEWVDMDGEARIQGQYVDIGADESDGCAWHNITLTPNPEVGTPGSNVVITANVKDQNGANAEDVTVCFTATGAQTLYVNGKLHSDMFGCDKTDASGNVTATIKRTTAGMTTLTATASRPCGTGQTTRKIDVWFGEPAEAVVVFCIDVTSSMTDAGGVSGAKAIEPIVGVIDDLRNAGVSLKLGGVKFQDVIHSRHPLTQDVDEFIDWLELPGYTHPYSRVSGDDPENQLQALVEAAKMATGQENLYLALATDFKFHDNTYPTGEYVTALTRNDVISLLEAAGCKVYIDHANFTDEGGVPIGCYYDNSDPECPNYDPNDLFNLAVNGAIEGDLGTYTFPRLKAAILAQ